MITARRSRVRRVPTDIHSAIFDSWKTVVGSRNQRVFGKCTGIPQCTTVPNFELEKKKNTSFRRKTNSRRPSSKIRLMVFFFFQK